MAGTRKKSKCLSLAEMRRRSTDYFFSPDTKRFFRGSKTSARCDRKTGKNYIKVVHEGRTAWYKFNVNKGTTDYVPAEKVPLKLRQK